MAAKQLKNEKIKIKIECTSDVRAKRRTGSSRTTKRPPAGLPQRHQDQAQGTTPGGRWRREDLKGGGRVEVGVGRSRLSGYLG